MTVSVLMPQMGESIAEGTLVRWIKKVGDTVDRDEPLFEISTDKVDAEIPSPAAGILTSVNVQEGETALVNSVVAIITEAGDASGAAISSGTLPAAVPAAVPAPAAGTRSAPAAETSKPASRPTGSAGGHTPTPDEVRREKSSPLVRRLAREHNVDVSELSGSGFGGRVTKQDILRHLESTPGAARPSGGVAPSGDRVESMSVMRRKIAEHMILSRRTSAHVHSVFEVNFSTVEKIRQARKADYEREGARLTYMAFIARATLEAIRRHPVINASIDGDNIVYRKDVNLGVAVALDNGLIVPVIRNAHDQTVLGLARSIADVAARARSKKLRPEEVTGGTFTITNPGQSGAQFGLPIINQPQVAILCVGTIEKRAVVIDDAIAIRLMGYLTLGFDHRLIDGAVADEFMADVKRQLEHFDPKDV